MNLALFEVNVNTLSSPTDMIEGSGRAKILLPNNTKLSINNALYSSRSRRNLHSFKDIQRNGYHIETIHNKNVEYLNITSHDSGQKLIIEKLCALPSELYYSLEKDVKFYALMN